MRRDYERTARASYKTTSFSKIDLWRIHLCRQDSSFFSFLEEGFLDNYWFSTGTPTMAITLAKKHDFSLIDLEMEVERCIQNF